MKIARIISLLLIVCMECNVKSMQPVYRTYVPLEERVLSNDLTNDQYLLAWENLPRYGKMLKQIRCADYVRGPNLYDDFYNDATFMIAGFKMYGKEAHEYIVKHLYTGIKDFIQDYYAKLKNAENSGYAILKNCS